MSPLSRFAPLALRSVCFHQQRGMAAAAGATDTVQRMFIEKIHEFKNSNRGPDEKYQKKEEEELARLKKVYQVDREAELATVDNKFSKMATISLGDLDDYKQRIKAMGSGEYFKQKQKEIDEKERLALEAKQASAVEVHHSPYHLPPTNRERYPELLPLLGKSPGAPQLGEPVLDYDSHPKALDPDEFERNMGVKFGKLMPTIDDDKSPERDLVNYPRHEQHMNLPPRIFHIIPKSWFDFFQPKTGVTGGYTFFTTLSVFLFSKEWIVMEHELLTGFSLTVIFTTGVIKLGPKLSAWADGKLNDSIKQWKDWREGHIEMLGSIVKHYKSQESAIDNVPLLYQARRDDIQIQLETEYRNRLKAVHDSTKRKLNYLVAVADSKRNIAHEFMVNWVIDNAVKSIGAKQEAEVLENCIDSLKSLSVRHANAI